MFPHNERNYLTYFVFTRFTQIVKYDDKLVRRYIEEIKVYEDKFTIRFKAKVEIEVIR